MALTYTNYRWEPINARKGDRYCYKRDVEYLFQGAQRRKPEEQVIATVTYDAKSESPHWGKWHVSFGAQSPELNALRMSDIPKFTRKDDAIAWVTAMVRFSL